MLGRRLDDGVDGFGVGLLVEGALAMMKYGDRGVTVGRMAKVAFLG